MDLVDRLSKLVLHAGDCRPVRRDEMEIALDQHPQILLEDMRSARCRALVESCWVETPESLRTGEAARLVASLISEGA